MAFFFAWGQDHESFDPQKHTQTTEEVFSCQIMLHEGSFPMACIRLKSQSHAPWGNKTTGFLSYAPDPDGNSLRLLFKGRLFSVPKGFFGGTMEILLTAEPLEGVEAARFLFEGLEKSPLRDPLFSVASQKDSLSEALEAMPFHICWSPVQEKPCLSGLFQGSQHHDIGQDFFEKSLKMSLKHLPVPGISLKVVARWVEDRKGRVDLTPALWGSLKDGLIQTYTGDLFKKSWWQEGERFGDSGYWVSESALEKVRVYDATHAFKGFSLKKEATGHKKEKRGYVKKTFFRPKLVLGYHYTQKREEHAEIWIPHALDDTSPRAATAPKVTFYLYPNDPKKQTFFSTDRGQHALSHAIERCVARIAASSRCVEVSFETSFEKSMAISCDHTVSLSDPRLPGGRVTGKVVAVTLVADGDQALFKGRITLACSMGSEDLDTFEKKHPDFFHYTPKKRYVEEGYYQEEDTPDQKPEEKNTFTTPSGLYVARPERPHYITSKGKKKPLKPLPMNPSAYDFMKDITWHMQAPEQRPFLDQTLDASKTQDQGSMTWIKNLQTQICLRMRKLKTMPCLTQHWSLKVQHGWRGPRQVAFPTYDTPQKTE